MRASFSADWRCSATSNLRHQQNVSWKRHSKVSDDVTFYRYQWKFQREDLKHLPCFFLKVACSMEYTSLLENLRINFAREAISAQHPGAVCCLHFGPSMPHFSSSESDMSWLLQKKWTFGTPKIRGLVQMMFHFNWAPCEFSGVNSSKWCWVLLDFLPHWKKSTYPGLSKSIYTTFGSLDPSSLSFPYQPETRKNHQFFMDGNDCFPTISQVKVWFIIQLKQPFGGGFFGCQAMQNWQHTAGHTPYLVNNAN